MEGRRGEGKEVGLVHSSVPLMWGGGGGAGKCLGERHATKDCVRDSTWQHFRTRNWELRFVFVRKSVDGGAVGWW